MKVLFYVQMIGPGTCAAQAAEAFRMFFTFSARHTPKPDREGHVHAIVQRPDQRHYGRRYLETASDLLFPDHARDVLSAALQHGRRRHCRPVRRQGGPRGGRRFHRHAHQSARRLLCGPVLGRDGYHLTVLRRVPPGGNERSRPHGDGSRHRGRARVHGDRPRDLARRPHADGNAGRYLRPGRVVHPHLLPRHGVQPRLQHGRGYSACRGRLETPAVFSDFQHAAQRGA